jgi:hypothetical protein
MISKVSTFPQWSPKFPLSNDDIQIPCTSQKKKETEPTEVGAWEVIWHLCRDRSNVNCWVGIPREQLWYFLTYFLVAW